MNDLLEHLLNWLASLSQSASGVLVAVESVDPMLRVLIAGLAAALEMFVVTGLVVPGDTVVLFAASVAGDPGEGILLGLVIAVGALLGETASYALGRWIGSSARGARARQAAGGQRVSAARRFLAERGGLAILAARFVPVLRTVMPFVVGLSGFSFKRFLAWSIPASIAWSAIYVTIYSLAAAPLREGSGSLVLTAGLAMLGLIVFGAAYVVQFMFERTHRGAAKRVEPTAGTIDAEMR